MVGNNFGGGSNNFRSTSSPKILYFLAGMVPTQDERDDAAQYGPVMFRNRNYVSSTHSLEPCDFVAGAVPSLYDDLPRAKIARALRKEVSVSKATPVGRPSVSADVVAPSAEASRPSGRKRPPARQTQVSDSDWGKQ